MNKNLYITPKVRTVDVRNRYGLLQGMNVGGSVSDEGDIGFSKRTDFDDDDNTGGGKGVWED